MSDLTIRRKIQKKFKIIGYGLKVDALDEILSFVNRFRGAEGEAIDLLLDNLHSESEKVGVKSSIIDKDIIHRVISGILEADDAAEQAPTDTFSSHSSAFRVIDAFSVPKFRFSSIKNQFYEHTCLPIHGDSSAKAGLYKDRYLLLLQRISRDQHFSKPAFDSDISHYGSCEIAPIQSLVGQTGRQWVMGVISQLEDGHFYLEDLTASVEISLSKAKITTGFLSENTIVVAEGEMLLDGIFETLGDASLWSQSSSYFCSFHKQLLGIFTCGFPPLEDRDKSLQLLSQYDFFGGGNLTKEETLRLAELEKRAVNDMFVILSDIWLDNEEVMVKLETVLDGFEIQDVVPCLFVFMGNFCSRPCNLSFHSFSSLRLQFGKLGKIIAAHPRLNGPDDAGPSTVLPRCALPKYLTEELQKHIPNVIFSSNPCRVRYYTQEIVFFRYNLLYRMQRSCLMPPSTEETTDPFEHLVATITHQSHLCPLPLIVQPIIWNYDHCLHLYPSPNTIVLGDTSEQKAFNYTGITCFNPGSFSNDNTFVAYRPCTQEVEFSAL